MPKISAYSFIMILLNVHSYGSMEGQSCSEKGIWHHSEDGSYVCCEEITCPPGEHVRLCDGLGQLGKNSSCHPCPAGHFRETPTSSLSGIYKCKRVRDCDFTLGMVQLKAPTPRANRICACNLADSWFDPDFAVKDDYDRPHFCRRKKCADNYESDINGSCVPCTLGSYKKGYGYARCVVGQIERETPSSHRSLIIGMVMLTIVVIIFASVTFFALVKLRQRRNTNYRICVGGYMCVLFQSAVCYDQRE